ncbi:MAG: prepilin peptidase [Candidatus Paceibacterota bacterium]|jgi:prepilin signal peptidase PulO-like enzyme (type II secretory pathway)
MDGLLLIFLFAFGLVMGSFLNVVILRYNTGKSLQGRSACFSCGTTLAWHHLVPLISFIAQRGHCAFCGSKISPQYPLVELATGILFVCSYLSAGEAGLLSPNSQLLLVFNLIATCLLIIIFVYDLRHKIIPDGIAYAFIGLGFIMLILRNSTPFDTAGAIADIVSAILIFFFFFSLWYFSKGTWMGLGDGKLALAMSLFLPWAENLSAIIISFWVGAGFGLLLMAYERIRAHKAVFWGPQKTALCGKFHSMKSELPFAPFMIIAFFLVLFSQLNLFYLLIV